MPIQSSPDQSVSTIPNPSQRSLNRLQRHRLHLLFGAALALGCAANDVATTGIDASACDASTSMTDTGSDVVAPDVYFTESCELREPRVLSNRSRLTRPNWINAAQVESVGFTVYPVPHRYGPTGDQQGSDICLRELDVGDPSVSTLWADILLRPVGSDPIHVRQQVLPYSGGPEVNVTLNPTDWRSLFPAGFEQSDIPVYITIPTVVGAPVVMNIGVDLHAPVIVVTSVVRNRTGTIDITFTSTENGIAGGDMIDQTTGRSVYPRVSDHTGCSIYNGDGKRAGCLDTNVCILQDGTSQCGDRRLSTGMRVGSNTISLPMPPLPEGTGSASYSIVADGADQAGNIGTDSQLFTY